MLESIPVVLAVSTALGFLAGIGVGGGSLLILWLTLILGYPQPDARILNLLFFIPSAVVATLFRWKQGKLDVKKVLPAILTGMVAAAIFSLLSSRMDTDALKKLFGGLLVVTGIRELMYRPRKKAKGGQ